MNDLMLPDERPLSPARFHATARELRRLPRRRRSRWGMAVALAGALVLLSAVAAVGYGLIRPQERFEAVGCYDQPSLDGSVAVVGTTERDPAEVCRELWADGAVAGSDEPVPADFTACVMPTDAAIGVFPDDDAVCDRLGLQALRNVEVSPGDVSIPRLEAALGGRLPSWEESDECLDSAETRRRAEQVLEDLGARDWSVTWQGDDADGDVSCGEIGSVDVPSRTIALNGVPGPGSEQVRVSRRLTEITGGACVGDRDEARAVAEQALRDLGLTEWTIDVSEESWDANVPGDIPGEQCASFQYYEPRTVSVESVIREPEGWRRFVPGM
jgi:hypothetical protein